MYDDITSSAGHHDIGALPGGVLIPLFRWLPSRFGVPHAAAACSEVTSGRLFFTLITRAGGISYLREGRPP